MDVAQTARDYRERGQYELALTFARRGAGAAARAEESRALIWLGRYAEARAAAQRAVEEAPASGAAWTVLSEACTASDELDTALAAAIEAIDRTAHAPTSAEHALALLARSAAEHARGQGPAAAAPAARAVAIFEQVGRPTDVALALHHLAEAQHVSGQYPLAAETWQRSLALRRSSLPSDHPEIGTTAHGMALTVRRLGLPQIAIDLHQQSLAIYKRCFDAEHPAVAACLHGLAQALHRCGRFPEARDHLAEALRLSELRQGPDHLHTWITRFELGRMEVDCGDPERGFARMEAARMRLTEKLGVGHPTVVAMKDWL